eukprot:Hpha_TRINITY_DN14081_c0_g2::TRINITY_DN14081_c0_g2_i1::g.44292::m.44292
MEPQPALPPSHADATADEQVFWCPVARRYRTTEQTTPPAVPQGGRRHISEFLGSQVPPRDPALPAAAVVVPIQKRDDRRRGRGQRARLHIADFMRLQNMTAASSTPSSTPQSQPLPPAALPPHSVGESSSIPSLGSPLPSSRHPACSPSVRSGSGPPLPPHLQATPRGCGDAWAREVAARSASMSSDGSARPVYPWGHGGQPYTPLQRNRQQCHATAEVGGASVGYTQSCTASDDALSCRSGVLRSSDPPAEVPPSPHTHPFTVSPLALQPVPSPQQPRLQSSPSCPQARVFQHNPYADPPTPSPELPPAACSTVSSAPPASPVSEVTSMRAVSEVTSVPSSAAPPRVSSTPTVATVQFKYGRQGNFHVPPGVCVTVGEHAIVEGDRGEDLGMIVATRMTSAADRADPLVMPLVRQATEEEASWWRNGLAELEREAMQEAQSVIEKYSVSMKIVHAEWQFDRKKLTFHFASREAQPDFRHLLGECHSIWKCRIWFAKHVKPEDAARVNLADK